MPNFPIVVEDVFSEKLLLVVEKQMREMSVLKVNVGLGDTLYGNYTPVETQAHLTALASKLVGSPLKSAISFIRLNHKTTDTSPRIHADSFAMGTVDFASVFYLDSNAEHGTALFKHPVHGSVWDKKGIPIFKDIEGWEPYFFYAAKRNTMVVYPADCFHSRWPIISYGSSEKDGRLIIVNFMRYLNDA